MNSFSCAAGSTRRMWLIFVEIDKIIERGERVGTNEAKHENVKNAVNG